MGSAKKHDKRDQIHKQQANQQRQKNQSRQKNQVQAKSSWNYGTSKIQDRERYYKDTEGLYTEREIVGANMNKVAAISHGLFELFFWAFRSYCLGDNGETTEVLEIVLVILALPALFALLILGLEVWCFSAYRRRVKLEQKGKRIVGHIVGFASNSYPNQYLIATYEWKGRRRYWTSPFYNLSLTDYFGTGEQCILRKKGFRLCIDRNQSSGVNEIQNGYIPWNPEDDMNEEDSIMYAHKNVADTDKTGKAFGDEAGHEYSVESSVPEKRKRNGGSKVEYMNMKPDRAHRFLRTGIGMILLGIIGMWVLHEDEGARAFFGSCVVLGPILALCSLFGEIPWMWMKRNYLRSLPPKAEEGEKRKRK